MKVYRTIFNIIDTTCPGMAAIGYFDAVHLGHQKIISELHQLAQKEGKIPYIITFTRHPHKEKLHKRILEFKDKLDLISQAGARNVIVNHFDERLAKLAPEQFLDTIRTNFGIDSFVIGSDFSFGAGRKGSKKTLEEQGFSYIEVSEEIIDGEKASATRIKNYIKRGECDRAAKLMGRPFFIRGTVQKGKQIGRQLGFPTMNMTNPDITYPPDGTYISQTTVDGITYPSMTYLQDELIESYLVGYEKFHYNFKIKVDFLAKIRDNQHFTNTEVLIAQIRDDLTRVEDYFNLDINKEHKNAYN
jgi:riboflavin kinase/FMN adenylyltransferase